jgi:nucleoside 2-deoxyribosyltransferase
LDLPGQTIVQIVREVMRRADLVVAVVDRTPDSGFVFYEIGFAQALEKPTFALLGKCQYIPNKKVRSC